MSVLILPDASGDLGRAVATRLLSQGDEVRVIVSPSGDQGWRELGVHVALGDPAAPDLVERAAQNCRTVVLLGRAATDGEVLDSVTDAAAAAGVDRLVLCRASERAPVPPLEGRWKGGFVVMEQTTGRWPRARSVADELVAEAVDAADDLAGDPRLVLDLNDPEGRAKLGL